MALEQAAGTLAFLDHRMMASQGQASLGFQGTGGLLASWGGGSKPVLITGLVTRNPLCGISITLCVPL